MNQLTWKAKKSKAWESIVSVLEEGVEDVKGPLEDLDVEVVLVRPRRRPTKGGRCPKLCTTCLSITDRNAKTKPVAEKVASPESQSLTFIKELSERLSTLEEKFDDVSGGSMSRGSNGSRMSKSEPSTVEESPRTSKKRMQIREPTLKVKEAEPKRRPATQTEPIKKPKKRNESEPPKKPRRSERRKSRDIRDPELEALMEGSRPRPQESVPVEGEEDPAEVCRRDNMENCRLCPKDNQEDKVEEVITANEGSKDQAPEEKIPTPQAVETVEEVMKELKQEEQEKEEPQDENVAPKKTDEEPQVYYVDGKSGFRRALEEQYRGISLKAKDSFILHKTRKGDRKKDRKKVREEKIYYVTNHEPSTIELLKKALPPSGYLCIESQPSTFSFISEPSDWDLPSQHSDSTLPPPNKPAIDIQLITNNMKTHVLNEIQKSWDDYIANLIKKI